MSYVLRPPVDTSGFVENPLTADLDADSNNISNAGTVTATTGDMTNVTIATALEHTNPAGVVGLYGAPPAPQHPPIPDSTTGSDHSITINQILNALRALGVISV